MRFFLTALILTTMSFPSYASDLAGSDIKQLISGKRVLLSTKWGAFPLRYEPDKQVTGDGSGLGMARFFAPKETGKWWITENQLCQQFPTWYKGRSFCFAISQTGPNEIKWVREDGYSGTATISQ